MIYNLSFTDSPRVQQIPPKTVKERATVTFYCIADGNPPPGENNYIWTDKRGRTKTTQNLKIEEANKNDTGEYTCTVSVDSRGGYGELRGSTKTTLTVQCK